MITKAVCVLKKQGENKNIDHLMEDSGGLAVGNTYNLNLDGTVGEWIIQKVIPLGPVGDFPKGKLNADDEGALRIAIGIEGKSVRIDFGKPVAWIGLPKKEAIQLATMILDKASQL